MSKRAPKTHRDVIAIERDAGQQVSVTIGAPTAGGRDVDGGYSQLFNRVMSSGIYAELPLPARAVYTAMVYLADNQRYFVVDGRDGKGVNIDRIVTVSGCGETAVKAAVRTLATRGLIRILRKGGSTPDGTRYASIYQLLLPVAGLEHLNKASPGRVDSARHGPAPKSEPGHATTPYRGASRPGTPATADPVPGRPADRFWGASRPATGAQRASSNRTARNKDISKAETRAGPATARSADAAELLKARGVGEPLLSKILADVDGETIARHCDDFDTRNALAGGAKKTAGWLVQSILVPYALHERTLAKLDDVDRAAKAGEHRKRQAIADALEAERLATVDRWVEEQFAATDDEELAALKTKVIAEYGAVARGLDRADPRTNVRLSRLIKGVLSQLYPSDA